MNTVPKYVNKIFQNYIYKLNLYNYSSTYSSALSLKNLYPNSNSKIVNPQIPQIDGNQFSGYIPIDQLEITYSRSSGPGGQNVNKVNTKVDLRFHLESATWLSSEIKAKLFERMKTRISKEGYLIFRSDVTRYQQLNVADCLNKLRTTIRSAAEPEPKPKPETAEKLRRRYEKAVIERLVVKRERSRIKEDRRESSLHNL